MKDAAPLALFALVCVAVSAWCIAQPPLLFVDLDAAHYLSIAEHLASGRGYQSSFVYFHDQLQPPLYPVLIAALIPIAGSSVRAAIVVCLAAQLGTLAALVGIHTRLFGARRRWLTAAIGSVAPALAFGAALMLEPLFVCTSAAAIYCTLAAVERESPRLAALAGIILGLAFLSRSEAVLIAVPLAVFVVVARARARTVLAFAVAVALVLLPYGMWMRARVGRFELLPKIRYNAPVARILRQIEWEPREAATSARYRRVLHGLMPDGKTPLLDYAFLHPEFDPASQFRLRAEPRPLVTLAHVREVISDGVFRFGLFHPLTLILFCAAAWSARTFERRRQLAFLAVSAAAAVALLPVLVSGEAYVERFYAAPLMLALPLAGGGAVVLIDALERRRRSRLIAPAVGGILIALFSIATVRLGRSQTGGPRLWDRTRAIERACGEVLPRGARLLAQHPRNAFLLGGNHIHLPYTRELDELRTFIAAHRPEYALLDGRLLRRSPSPVDSEILINPAKWPSEWHLLRTIEMEDGPVHIVRLQPAL